MSRRKQKESNPKKSGHVLKVLDDTKLSRRTFIKGSMVVGATGAMLSGGGLKGVLDSSNMPLTSAPSTTFDPYASFPITLNINGAQYSVTVQPRDMLVNVLRENIGLIATKRPCNRMECGGCTVLIDGQPHYSCTTPAYRAAGHQILTSEGGSADPVLAAVEAAWGPADASQCGYCQPGRVMAATALLKVNTSPNVAQIQEAVNGNLCRCGTYLNVITAVQNAAKALGGNPA